MSFDAGSEIVQVHHKNHGEPLYIHEDRLRRQPGPYGLLIDRALQTRGEGPIVIQLDLSAKVVTPSSSGCTGEMQAQRTLARPWATQNSADTATSLSFLRSTI
jgi:hypothetical protein